MRIEFVKHGELGEVKLEDADNPNNINYYGSIPVEEETKMIMH